MVMILESWVTMAKPGETLDTETPPSEAFDREEFVVVMGETVGRKTQRFLPILRTDAGGFFGFGEFDASKFDGIEGRFAGMLPPKETTPENAGDGAGASRRDGRHSRCVAAEARQQLIRDQAISFR